MATDPDVPPHRTREAPDALESTLEMIERVRQGDQDALDRLLARHTAPLRRWVSGRLPRWARDLADTDDLVQDTLLRTFPKIRDFEVRGEGALQAYLRQAVLNRLRDELRRKSRPTARLDELTLDLEAPGSQLEDAIGRQAAERYQAALNRLRPIDREAIVGRLEMDYSYAELAEALGKSSPDAARKTTRRALLRLAEEMRRR